MIALEYAVIPKGLKNTPVIGQFSKFIWESYCARNTNCMDPVSSPDCIYRLHFDNLLLLIVKGPLISVQTSGPQKYRSATGSM